MAHSDHPEHLPRRLSGVFGHALIGPASSGAPKGMRTGNRLDRTPIRNLHDRQTSQAPGPAQGEYFS